MHHDELIRALEKIEEETQLALEDPSSPISADRLRLVAALARYCRAGLDGTELVPQRIYRAAA